MSSYEYLMSLMILLISVILDVIHIRHEKTNLRDIFYNKCYMFFLSVVEKVSTVFTKLFVENKK